MSPPLLELTGVSKAYADGDSQIPVLDTLDLRLEAGETLAVLGPSGSGKTTLLNLLGGLDRPDAGQVLLDGEDLAALAPRQLARVRNRQVGMVFQLHHLLPQCSALENVLVPDLVARLPGARERAEELLTRLGLGRRLDHRPGRLSGGERQRVALARALINRPRLLLADEPTGSLDRQAAAQLTELLAGLPGQEGTGVVAVTHSTELAARLGRALELRDGRLHPPEDHRGPRR